MNIDQSHIKSLFQKHLQGTATPEEIHELFDQIGQEKIDEEILSSLDSELMETDPLNHYEKERWDTVFMNVKDDVSAIEEEVPVRRKKFGYAKVGIAAAVALIALGAYFFNAPRHPKLASSSQTVQNDGAPGKAGATLTLASGKKIRLTDAANGQLANESGIGISKTADGQLVYEIKGTKSEPDKINILSTSKGETYSIRLPDGSLVYLNAASSLTYTTSLIKHGKRIVKLRGEGYFEVFKDKAHPFVVETDQQQVEVLGTHFNINAYEDEPATSTTLLEGSVKIIKSDKEQLLKPGEQALNNGNTIKVVKINPENSIDWKDGDFYLERVNFKTAMRKIARWYDMEVQYDVTITDDIESGGWVSRNNKLSEVLKALESTGLAHFRIEGRKIYVYK